MSSKYKLIFFYLLSGSILLACSDKNAEKSKTDSTNSAPQKDAAQGTGIIGEWEQEYTCYDKNNNYKLEPEERKHATMLGFDYFRFNTD